MLKWRLMTKTQFLLLASGFEGGLIAVAYLLGWWLEINPLASLRLHADALGVSLLATFWLIWVFGLTYHLPVPELQKIRRLLVETLGSLLSSCRWYELVYIATLAGVGEEILFRGLLQPWMETMWGKLWALLISNLLFGLAHSVTPLYTLLAALTGVYLGWLLDVGGERNLLIPMIVHAAYDLAAFFVVAAAYRSEHAA